MSVQVVLEEVREIHLMSMIGKKIRKPNRELQWGLGASFFIVCNHGCQPGDLSRPGISNSNLW